MTKTTIAYAFLAMSQLLIATMIYIGGGLMYSMAYLGFVCAIVAVGLMNDAEEEKSKGTSDDNADAQR